MTPFDTSSCSQALHTLNAACVLQTLPAPARRELRQAVQALAEDSARVVLLNLVRGLPLVRGFTLSHRARAGACGAHPWAGFVAALPPARHWLARKGRELVLGDEVVRALDDVLADALRLAHLHAVCLAHDARHRSARIQFMAHAMRATPQGRVTDAWSHGQSAARWYRFFSAWLHQGGRPARHLETSWPVRLPAWFEVHGEALRARLAPLWLALVYLQWHDCGKPWVLERDANGRLHYPDHARISRVTWEALELPRASVSSAQARSRLGELIVELPDAGLATAQARVRELIEHDMCAHLWREVDLAFLCQSAQGPTLLVAALAELHCNAGLFGGLDSESFRIKAKRLASRGRALCEHWFGPQAPAAITQAQG